MKKAPPQKQQPLSLVVSSAATFSCSSVTLKPETVAALQLFTATTGTTTVVPDTLEFPFHFHQQVVQTVVRLQPSLKVNGVPGAVLRALQHCLTVKLPAREQLLTWVPPKLLDNLYDYQKDGVAFAVAHGGRCMIADEMGVGKSRQGLAVLSTFRREWPALLLCPSSLKGQWKALVEEWLPLQENGTTDGAAATREMVVRVAQKGTDPLDGDVNIISYDLAAGKEQEISARNFQVMLVDESHYLKSRTARRSKVLIPLLSRARRIVLMTGTPALSRPSELFTQLHLLRPDLFSHFHAFGERYCNATRNHFGWDYSGSSNLHELYVLLEATCVIRRTKQEVLGTALPPKTRERIGLVLTNEQHALIEKSVSALATVTERAKSKFVDPVSKKAAFLTVWRDVGRAKIPTTIEYLNGLLERGEKFLFFAHHQFVLDEVEAFIERKNVRFIRIDGKTPPKHRTRQVDEFQEHPDVRVAILSITAAGCGITLTAARIVVFGELYFNVGNLLQAEDRCHRVGQTDPVQVCYLIAERTVEQAIWYMLAHKMETVGRIHGVANQRFGASVSQFDEELTQTDMSEFIAAMCGGSESRLMLSAEDLQTTTTTTTTKNKRQKVVEELPESKQEKGKKSDGTLDAFVYRRSPAVINTAPPNWTPPPVLLQAPIVAQATTLKMPTRMADGSWQ